MPRGNTLNVCAICNGSSKVIKKTREENETSKKLTGPKRFHFFAACYSPKSVGQRYQKGNKFNQVDLNNR